MNKFLYCHVFDGQVVRAAAPGLQRRVIESYTRLSVARSIFRSMERTNFRCEKGTYLKAKFRLWFESGWWHALVGAELGQVLLTVRS